MALSDRWTPDERRRVLRAMGSDLPSHEWAARMGCSVKAIQRDRKALRGTQRAARLARLLRLAEERAWSCPWPPSVVMRWLDGEHRVPDWALDIVAEAAGRPVAAMTNTDGNAVTESAA